MDLRISCITTYELCTNTLMARTRIWHRSERSANQVIAFRVTNEADALEGLEQPYNDFRSFCGVNTSKPRQSRREVWELQSADPREEEVRRSQKTSGKEMPMEKGKRKKGKKEEGSTCMMYPDCRMPNMI